MKKLVLVMALILASSNAFALEDSPENRSLEAERYLTVISPRDSFQDAAQQMSKNFSPEKREQFVKAMTQYVDVEAVVKAYKEAMVKIYTADELAAMADFYGSAVGISAMKKSGAYMAEIMPVLQAEALKALSKANREFKEPEEKSGSK